jgi:hypothetical protein
VTAHQPRDRADPDHGRPEPDGRRALALQEQRDVDEVADQEGAEAQRQPAFGIASEKRVAQRAEGQGHGQQHGTAVQIGQHRQSRDGAGLDGRS